MNFNRSARDMTPTRRAIVAAGIATLAMSLVLSIAPAIAANAGTVKVFDAVSGDELGNDPHVCSFYAAFFASHPPETGTWQLLDWGRDKSVVASGAYDTSLDGVDVTAVLSPDPGHYRFEWLSTGDNNSKNKMLWVNEECADTGASVPGPSVEPSVDPSVAPSVVPSVEPSVEPSAAPSVVPSVEPSVEPSAAPDPSDSSSNTKENEVLTGNSRDGSSGADENVVAPNIGSGPMLPDTAVPVAESGVLATIGILLIIAAHAGTRRTRPLSVA